MPDEAPVIRPAARVLLLDAQDRVLLMFFTAVARGRGVWITPGGGLDEGESFETAAVRELWEEIGLRDAMLGPCVWFRAHRFFFRGTLIEQQERFFVCRVDSHDVGDHLNLDEQERQEISEVRWWTLDEIEASPDLFAPMSLATLLPPILRGELPSQPFNAGR